METSPGLPLWGPEGVLCPDHPGMLALAPPAHGHWLGLFVSLCLYPGPVLSTTSWSEIYLDNESLPHPSHGLSEGLGCPLSVARTSVWGRADFWGGDLSHPPDPSPSHPPSPS